MMMIGMHYYIFDIKLQQENESKWERKKICFVRNCRQKIKRLESKIEHKTMTEGETFFSYFCSFFFSFLLIEKKKDGTKRKNNIKTVDYRIKSEIKILKTIARIKKNVNEGWEDIKIKNTVNKIYYKSKDCDSFSFFFPYTLTAVGLISYAIRCIDAWEPENFD